MVKLVEACNLACAYCYQSGRLNAGQVMEDQTLGRVLAELHRVTSGPASLLWYGGEPTLVGLGRFSAIVARADELFSRRGGVAHSLQTNAVLIDEEWADFLACRSFGVSLSLDGPAQLHDAARPRAGGAGSHAAVERALGCLQRAGLKPRAACVVDRHTLDFPELLVDYFHSLGLHEIDFPPALRAGPGGLEARVTALEYGRFMTRVLDRWLALGQPNFRIRSLAGVVRKLAGLSSSVCKLEGDCSSYVTFAHNGDVYPCDEFSAFPETRLGNVRESPLDSILAAPEARTLYSSWAVVPEECSDCRWREMCRGSCPFERKMAGGVDRPSILCDGLKLIFERVDDILRAARKT
ncbi:MAG: anaerobic sulfatase maturase [Candidatus Xenobia bacterium]